MQSEFTEKAQTALSFAEKISREYHAGYIGTEHILAGLLREGTGVAAVLLRENQIFENRLQELMRETLTPQGGLLIKERRDYSAKALEVLNMSHQIA
ncbi:MAG: Clp protease N-terminal domain-containing protein, partial [Lachnospiraceae bacterium]|nr:Clp protease N-terminal domain-containing protein [Lachnospiraceae bacterium]